MDVDLQPTVEKQVAEPEHRGAREKRFENDEAHLDPRQEIRLTSSAS